MQLEKSKFHFVGIGGIGMCGLAELLYNMGAQVTGSDLGENANTKRLKDMGIKIFLGHDSKNIGEPEVVVYSSAVSGQNPELQFARSQKIPVIPRAEALAEIMRLKRGVAVAGSHGKTTTTSMVASVFLQADLEPTIVVGGRFDMIKSTARLGTGTWMIAEADESDGSFQKLSPEIAIITNVDNDHLDYFKSFENLKNAFYQFALRIPFYGSVIVCGDDTNTRKLFENFPKKVLFYGFDSTNDYILKGGKGRYELNCNGKVTEEFTLNIPGRHNALNATAAVVAGLEAGISFQDCKKGLLKFNGVDRRFHLRGTQRGVEVYDDYGHHPTEIRATLQAFREKYPNQNLTVLFQPHRYSRTETCWKEFTSCFADCDEVSITDIYAAGESPIPGITAEKLAQQIVHEHCRYLPRTKNLAETIALNLKPETVFVVLGAGDIWKVSGEVLELLGDFDAKTSTGIKK